VVRNAPSHINIQTVAQSAKLGEILIYFAQLKRVQIGVSRIAIPKERRNTLFVAVDGCRGSAENFVQCLRILIQLL